MKERINVFVGSRIKYIRRKRKMTQKELGEKLGVKHNTISSYESGSNEPELDIMFRLAEVLGVSINDFFPYSESIEHISSTDYTYFPTAISAGLPFQVDGITDASKINIPDELMGKWAGSDDIFFVKANGDSMDEIFPCGSLLAVKDAQIWSLKENDIVVFSEGLQEYSVKQFFKDDEKLIFKPRSRNLAHHEQHYTMDDNIHIHGIVVTYIVNVD